MLDEIKAALLTGGYHSFERRTGKTKAALELCIDRKGEFVLALQTQETYNYVRVMWLNLCSKRGINTVGQLPPICHARDAEWVTRKDKVKVILDECYMEDVPEVKTFAGVGTFIQRLKWHERPKMTADQTRERRNKYWKNKRAAGKNEKINKRRRQRYKEKMEKLKCQKKTCEAPSDDTSKT